MATVLYVEDEEDDIFFMRRAFSRAGLTHVLQAVADGQEAINYLSGCGRFANRIDYPLPEMVLLDLNLPMVSGFQVLQWIRAQSLFQRLPVVIFSSSARVEDRLLANELGASDYLEKPGSSMQFRDLLESLNKKWLENGVAAHLPGNPPQASHAHAGDRAAL